MLNKIESIYQTIADKIVNSIPQKWETAWIEAEIEEDYTGIDGYF